MARARSTTDVLARRIAAECLGVRIRLLSRVVTRIFDDAIRPHGITTAQLNVMVAVALKGPVRPTAVARALAIEKSTLSRNLRVLEANGLVAIEAGDAGGQRLRLTATGARRLQAAAGDWERAQAAAERALGAEGTAGIRSASARVREGTD
jgi:DNA-binding MarR family transcriptional regulator